MRSDPTATASRSTTRWSRSVGTASHGLQASGGLAERSDRLVSVLVVGFFSDVLNLPILLKIVLCALAIAMGLFLALTRRRAGTEVYA